MKTTKIFVSALCLTLVALSANFHRASADFIVSNLALTTNSVSFDISGAFPAPLPLNGRFALAFVNPNISASPGFALGDFIAATTHSFSGSQALRSSPSPVATGGQSYGDYFYVVFESPFAGGRINFGNLIGELEHHCL